MSASDRSPAEDAGWPGINPDPDVMAALDEEDLIIADVSCEDAWLTVPAAEAPRLAEWR